MGYLCCAACLHAILEEQEKDAVMVDGYWYHRDHIPRPAEPVAIET